MPARGYALHIGVPSPAALEDKSFAPLPGAVLDANDLATVASSAGFATTVLIGPDATTTRVLDELRSMRAKAVAGDSVVITFSGHGWQIRTTDPHETDHFDEIWMLADGFLVDTSVGSILHSYPPEVAVVVILDACRSRTATFIEAPRVVDVPLEEILEWTEAPDIIDESTAVIRRAATVLTLSAVDRDDASAYENPTGGVFTDALQASLEQLRVDGSAPTWGQLWSRTVGHVYAYQHLDRAQSPRATLRGSRQVLDHPAFAV